MFSTVRKAEPAYNLGEKFALTLIPKPSKFADRPDAKATSWLCFTAGCFEQSSWRLALQAVGFKALT